jgi:hypothetical protein
VKNTRRLLTRNPPRLWIDLGNLGREQVELADACLNMANFGVAILQQAVSSEALALFMLFYRWMERGKSCNRLQKMKGWRRGR